MRRRFSEATLKGRLRGALGYLGAALYAAVFYRFPRPQGWVGGRHRDPDPIRCDRCAWGGMRRAAIHDYEDDGLGDVTPVDRCPICGGDI